MRIMKNGSWVLAVCIALAAAAQAYRAKPSPNIMAAASQDVISLDRRISQLEQRLYSTESNISRLEQQISISQRPAPPQASQRDPDIDLLRSELERVKLRVRELECGVVHIDERTLPATAKESRKRAGAQSNDPCRQNPETPVRLSMHP
jgi:hypothetical protein